MSALKILTGALFAFPAGIAAQHEETHANYPPLVAYDYEKLPLQSKHVRGANVASTGDGSGS